MLDRFPDPSLGPFLLWDGGTLAIREYILFWTSQVGSDARIEQLEGRSLESCLSWLRSHGGCPNQDLFMLEYSKCENLRTNCLLRLRLSCIINFETMT